MRYTYRFDNLCGTVYSQGDILFEKSGQSLLAPVKNRIGQFDLINASSHTLPLEHRLPIHRMALSPCGVKLICVDKEGKAVLINVAKRVVLSRFSFGAAKKTIGAVQFSPCGEFVAVGTARKIQVWRAPGLHKEFAPFVLFRTYSGAHDDITHIDWTGDSAHFVAASKDCSSRIYSLHSDPTFRPLALSGHRDHVRGVFFSKNEEEVYSISRDGALFVWEWRPEELIRQMQKEDSSDEDSELDSGEGSSDVKGDDSASNSTDKNEIDSSVNRFSIQRGRFKLCEKHFFMQERTTVTSVDFHAKTSMLVVGFSSGTFGLYMITPEFNCVHTLSISQHKIDTCRFNGDGNWIALGSGRLGQLLVWEWRSETYLLRQQGHQHHINAVAYAPDGQLLASGADDGKVKLWNARSGFCFVTFAEHTAPVTGVCFSQNGHVTFSASLDGTVRAFDLIRYRNFRVLVAPTTTPAQFSCVAVDPSGDIVVAGTVDSFEIVVWSVQTGRVTDVLGGHEGPVSALTFSPIDTTLASSSWDKTMRVWDLFERKTATESFDHGSSGSDVLAVAYRPDGRELATSSLDGLVRLWDPHEGSAVGTIDGRRDIAGGRVRTEHRTAKQSNIGRCFQSIAYSPDGQVLICGGDSKFVCLYAVSTRVLLKKFQISYNRALDGMRELLAPRDDRDNDEDDTDHSDNSDERHTRSVALPGVSRGDMASRKRVQLVRSSCVQMSPTGHGFAVASTDGLLLYALDDTHLYDPFDLDIDITPASARQALRDASYLQALVIALRLDVRDIMDEVIAGIPVTAIALVVDSLPGHYLVPFARFLTDSTSRSRMVELHLRWAERMLSTHGEVLKGGATGAVVVLRALRKALQQSYDDVLTLAEKNRHTMQLLVSLDNRVATMDDATLDRLLRLNENNAPASTQNGDTTQEHIEHNDSESSGEGEWLNSTTTQTNTNSKSKSSRTADEAVAFFSGKEIKRRRTH